MGLVNCSFTNNAAQGGGGLPGGAPGYPGGNGNGGAVWNSGLLLASGCTFARNSALGGDGGQGANAFPSSLSLQGYAGGAGGDGDGAALFNSGTAYLVNCTLAANTGAGGGGGAGTGGAGGYGVLGGSGGLGANGGAAAGALYCAPSASCEITNCTFAGNAASGGDGGSGGGAGYGTYQSGSPGTTGAVGDSSGGIQAPGVGLLNTLLAANTPGNATGAVTDWGCRFTSVGSQNNTDPQLAPLAANGGPTPTMALLPGSPAIDAGDDTGTTIRTSADSPAPLD